MIIGNKANIKKTNRKDSVIDGEIINKEKDEL